MSEETPLVRACSGDPGAFSALVEEHAGAVWNYLRRFMPAAADREDLFQDVFVKAWLRIGSFDPGRGSLRTWLLRIAATTSLDEIKRRRRERAREEDWVGEADAGSSGDDERPGETPAEEIREALGSLPDTERQVVVLAFYHDLSMPRIADLLGIPLGTIKSRMRSALRRLKERTAVEKAGEL